jgi:hypothetical protein
MVLVGIGLLACLLAGEVGARAIAPRLSSAGTWPEGEISEQYDKMSELERSGKRVDVAFAGSSMIKWAIDAKVFSRKTGQTAVNAWLPASSNVTLSPWLIDVVVPLLHPKTVVIEVSTRDFNDRVADNDALRTLTTSPGYLQRTDSDSLLTQIDSTLAKRIALVRVRRSLREPTKVIDALTGPRQPWDRHCPNNLPARGRRLLRRYPENWRQPYSATNQTLAILDVVDKLEARGVEVVLLRLPTAYDYVRALPGEDNVVGYEAAMGQVVEQTGVPVIDGRRTVPIEQFRDYLHVTCDGMDTFTRSLIKRWPAS